jgi:phage shock protein PspC (stress-responsive transcriptional regulator)
MNRVTIVNLAGRAWHVEEAGVAALEAWLAEARVRLAADPDQDELITDFERAIADRLEVFAPDARDVVTSASVAEVLTALGSVEPAGDAPDDASATATTTPMPATGDGTDTPLRDRRLYRLGGDEAMVGGVCGGLAAYLRVDVTVVRVLVVLLMFITSGAAFLAYIVMWLIVPEAKTPEERAHASGSGRTAQEMLARARDEASPALTSLGSFLARAFIILGNVTRWILLAAIWTILVAWGITIGWLLLDPDIVLDAFDPGTSVWLGALWVTCIAWIPTALLIALERGLSRLLAPAPERSRPATIATSSAWVVSVTAAAIGLVAIPAYHSGDIAGLRDGQGRVELLGQEICLDVPDELRTADRDHDCGGADIVIEDEGRNERLEWYEQLARDAD